MNVIRKKIENIKVFFKKVPVEIWIIVGVGFLLLLPALEGFVIKGYDYLFHKTNLHAVNHALNISSFEIAIPKIFGLNIANNFGYGTGIFYPPISFFVTGYLSKIVVLLGLPIDYTITIVELIITIFSGLTMFLLLHQVSKDKNVSLIGSLSYICAPYLLTDIYIRGSYSELFTFIFVPLVFLGLHELFHNQFKNFYLYFTMGYVGMILSHLVITVYLTIFICILFLINIKKVVKWDYIKHLIIASMIVLLLTSPFWIPLLEHKIFGNYVVFQEDAMSSVADLKESSLYFRDFFITNPNIRSNINHPYLNFGTILLFFIGIYYSKRIFDNKKMYLSMLVLTVISIFMTTVYFPWSVVPKFLQTIQFPWRLEIFIVFRMSFIGAYSIKIWKSEQKKIATILFSILIIWMGFDSIYVNTVASPVDYETPYNLAMGSQSEYLPVKTKKEKEYLLERDKKIHVVKGKAEINEVISDTPYLKANIEMENSDQKVILQLPRIYYFGYSITLTTDDQIEKIDYYEDEHGFIEIHLNKSGILEMKYEGTIMNQISKIVCFVTLLFSIAWFYRNFILRNNSGTC